MKKKKQKYRKGDEIRGFSTLFCCNIYGRMISESDLISEWDFVKGSLFHLEEFKHIRLISTKHRILLTEKTQNI